MDDPHRLPLLKKSMKRLVPLLRPNDRVAIVKYSGLPYVDLQSVSANQKDTINKTIDSLDIIGVTHGVKGLEKAYEIAEQNYIEEGNNQIILSTDGLFREEDQKDNSLYRMVRNKAENEGIILSVVGYGDEEGERGQKAIELMEELAADGQGHYIHVHPGNVNEAKDALIKEIKANSIKWEKEEKKEASFWDRF
jgi:Ca-activated chloride channel family protein